MANNDEIHIAGAGKELLVLRDASTGRWELREIDRFNFYCPVSQTYLTKEAAIVDARFLITQAIAEQQGVSLDVAEAFMEVQDASG